jgi:hypothetical protein
METRERLWLCRENVKCVTPLSVLVDAQTLTLGFPFWDGNGQAFRVGFETNMVLANMDGGLDNNTTVGNSLKVCSFRLSCAKDPT